MIYLQSTYQSPRLIYTADYLFKQRLGLEYTIIVGDSNVYKENTIVYSKKTNGKFCIFDSGFLNKTDITEFEPQVNHLGNSIYLFPVNNGDFSLKFDIFSAIFYLISRYEEYLPFEKDIHGRFDTEQSFAFRNNFHQRAIIDEWIMDFREVLHKHFPTLKMKKEKFDYEITIDVDMIFSYRGKGFIRNAGGWFRDLMRGRLGEFFTRPMVLLGLIHDPYDTFTIIKEIEKKAKKPFIYFILFAKKRSQLDKNTSRKHIKTQQIIKKLAGNNPIGLHPSHAGNMSEEKKALENLIGKEITLTRQHYLKMSLPETYVKLQEAGFTDDYTMGFASMPGYRAGTSRPFKFFNLAENKITDLTIHPFAVMDGSYKDYNNLPVAEVQKKLEDEISYLKKINGRFSILLHNETFSESKRWKGWRKLIIDLLNFANKE